ncbi:Rhodanese-related sulfurtransferase [Thioflavicoccus mobilis 8321]|uniref:Rhodanese-related sulfurtransferase n=1 Tax=Thioflavicoccus mobilis 8321 TaxID=765912 RepID=L0GZY4_9GAMM|nr:Rhodanese-related sulfurtransferase [Thioflavicoccus mobilis 8321]
MILEFVGNNWLLVLAFVVISGLLIQNLLVGNKGAVDPVEATDLINHKDAVVVDVRPAADFSKGHIVNAINIPFNGFKNQLGILHKHKERPVIVNCRSGSQSALACRHLRKEGFPDVHNLRGGIMAWENAGLPLTRKKR